MQNLIANVIHTSGDQFTIMVGVADLTSSVLRAASAATTLRHTSWTGVTPMVTLVMYIK